MAATQFPFTASGGIGPTQIAANSLGDGQLILNTAAGLSALRVAHAKYSFAVDGGVVGPITPASTAVIPINAIIYNAIILVTTAVTSSAGASLSVGTTAGSAADSIMTATAKGSLGAGVFGQSTPVPNSAVTFVKMSAAGSINVTVATTALTAGIVEIFVFYATSST